MCLSSTPGNLFLYVQSGKTPSDTCILNEFPIYNSTVSVQLCCMQCSALPQCVGIDIIENEAKTCRLLRGFTAVIPTPTTSNEAVRYEKVHALGFKFVITLL